MSQAQTLTPAALYARSSSVNQEEHAARSVQAQLDAVRDYAEGDHMSPVSHFVAKSGSREEFDWMMAQATSDNPPFRTILVYSFNRLTRSGTELWAIPDELTANGLEVISIREPRNPSTLA